MLTYHTLVDTSVDFFLSISSQSVVHIKLISGIFLSNRSMAIFPV